MEIQLWRSILCPYELAVRELEVKFNHIIDECKENDVYCPIEQVEGRVKSVSSILEKMQRKNISWEDLDEKVEDIAAKFNTSPDIIRHANNIPARTNLKFGSAILVPKTAGFNQDIAPELVNSARIAWEQDAPATRLVSVPVRKKANVASIAKRYRVSVAQLKSWNSIKGDSIPKGTILKVHVPSRSASGKAVRAGTVSAVRGSSRASRVKVVMDKQERTSSKKGLVKSRNARSAKSVSTKKQAKPVKAQASAKKTTAKKRSSSKKKA